MATLFEKLGQPPPAPIKKAQKLPAQLLLDFLQRWPKPTVTARNVCQFGPHANRKLENVISSAEVLVKSGWLTPIKANRHDTHQWQIIKKLVVHPTVSPN
jgi:hypothetical protein